MISAFDFKFFKERSLSRASRNGFCSLSFFVAGRLWRQMRIPTAFRISVDTAKRAAAAAIAEAHKNNWTVAVAILDTADNLVYYEKVATARHWRLRVP
jgi:hypothetical protein